MFKHLCISFLIGTITSSAFTMQSKAIVRKTRPSLNRSKSVKTVDTEKTKKKSSSTGTLKIEIENPLLKAIKENNTEQAMMIFRPDINATDLDGNTLLTLGIRNNNIEIVTELLQRPELQLNRPNRWGINSFQYALIARTTIETSALKDPERNKALQINATIIHKLIHDIRVDTSLQINDTTTNQTIITPTTTENIELRNLLFTRILLDQAINQFLKKSLLSNEIDNNSIDHIVIQVKEHLNTIKTNQNCDDRKLPDKAALPDYATDEVIKKIIKSRSDMNLIQPTNTLNI
jgi:ankyrin repeat protein